MRIVLALAAADATGIRIPLVWLILQKFRNFRPQKVTFAAF